jgi:hypothetical protein
MLHGSRIEPGMTAGVGDDDNLAKSQIISQAATARLAQANQSKQSVLALLKS